MCPKGVSGSRGLDRYRRITFRTKEYPTIKTGIPPLDEILLGGFRKDSIVHFYGEPGAGKSTFAMQIMVNIMKQGWKAIWVDCNGVFSIQRFQMLLTTQVQLLNELIYVRPKSFQEQTDVLGHLKFHLDRVGIVVVDPFTHFYRAERYKEASQGYFHELIAKQLASLVGITHLQKIPVIIINYGTIRDGDLIPLAEKGFERVERYRFCFKNLQTPEDAMEKQLVIEHAPESYTRGRTLSFTIGAGGVEAIHLVRKQGGLE